MPFNYKTKPYEHQKEALLRSFARDNYAYFMEMGCGKSKVLIDNTTWLYENKHIDTVIIVAPKGVYMNWKNAEIPTHLPDNVPNNVYVWKASANKTEKKILEEGVKTRDKLRILLVNVEAFATAKVIRYLEAFTHRSNFLLAVDESTTIKNIKAKRTKAILKLGQSAKYKRILTGSPITQSPMDLYSQCYFLDKDLLGFDSYWSFQGRYAVVRQTRIGNHSFQQVVGFRNLEELTDKLHRFAYRVTKEQALDLPEKIYTTRQVVLTSDQIKHYNSMKDSAVAFLDGGDLVSAPEVMTRLLRLQQLLCGYLVTDDGETVEIANHRIDAMLDTIAEMDGKVIIWSRFRHDIKKIRKSLDKAYGSGTVVTYFGDTSQEDRDKAIDRFQNDKGTRFFVGNAQTAGRGLTLTAATNVIYYSNDFNLETRIQSEDRCHRIGQKNNVLYVDLVVPDSIDVHIVKVLQSKITLAGKTLGEEARKWLKVSPKRSD
jgi:SNF2 family DNA or RNA helicase|tara:strand:+ start:613 stop:2070 length:1458 start_codon:yes stop_codon:yes gene_type:complete